MKIRFLIGLLIACNLQAPDFDDWVMIDHPESKEVSSLDQYRKAQDAKDLQNHPKFAKSPKSPVSNLSSTPAPKSPISLRSSPENDHVDVKSVSVLQQDSKSRWENLESITVPDSPVQWKHVREEEGTNCAYHALKNIRLVMDVAENSSLNPDRALSNPNSVLNQQLHDRRILFNDLALKVPDVYKYRKQKIFDALRKDLSDEPISATDRATLQDHLKSRVNVNDGHIKTENLDGFEVENLLKKEEEEFEKSPKKEKPAFLYNTLVLEYIPGIPVSAILSEAYEKRLDQFKGRQNDQIGIMWNEAGFGHWIGYVAVKKEGKITLYDLNSVKTKKPAYLPELIKLLQ